MAITDGLLNLENREEDGTGNNLLDTDLGAANTVFTRVASADYADGVGAPQDRGNAREISNAIVDQDGPIESSAHASNLFTFFGQFIDHDIDLTPTDSAEQLVVQIPADDGTFNPAIPLTLNRSVVAPGTGENGVPREQVNKITSFADASNIYGSSAEVTSLLRADSGASAYLLTDANGNAPTMGQLRAIYPDLDATHPDLVDGAPTNDAYVAGDVRVNENVALTSMHSVWIVEHNNQVGRLSADHPDWTQDQLFEGARVIVEALYQNVVFNEYLPFLLGEDNIPEYTGYDETIDPSIATEFATAAYRLGHSQLSSVLHRTNEDGSTVAEGNLGLFEAFFSPTTLTTGGGVDALVRGLAGEKGQEIDVNIVDDVRNLLFANSGAGTDLASLNIMRGRDHGIPTLNDMRTALGLEAYNDFSDLTGDPALAAQFAEVYGSISDVDLWVGGLAEEKVQGSQLGATFHAIVLDQFVRLRDGDRFYFEERLKEFPELLEEIKDTSFSDILLRTTGIEYLQDDVFVAHNRIGGTADDDYLPGTNEHDLIIGLDGDDHLAGYAGDDDLYGGNGHDYLRGNAGNDVLAGEAGDDAIEGGRGDDEITGGDGNDWLNGGRGNDTVTGGDGYDVVLGASGNDKLFGDSDGTATSGSVAFFDTLIGGSGNDVLVGDALKLEGSAVASADYLEGGRGNDIIYGDAVTMSGTSAGGDDNLQGGRGNDTLYGDAAEAGTDTTGGNDYLVGGRGNDTLVGGKGSDFLVGGDGNDIFVFGPDSGEDIVWDFGDRPGNNDVIDVSAYGFASTGDFNIFDVFGDTVLGFTDTDDVTLVGVDSSSLSDDDFIFV